ncbi:MAG: LPS assembly lipoprotein LptE [Planctomycetaceae bacterium]
MDRKRQMRILARRAMLVLTLLGVCGCGYVVGYPSAPGVQNVHVPTFTTDSFRRGYELQLTEAVQKRIMDATPYRLVGADQAQTELIGHVRSVTKRSTNQSRFDDPRQLELNMQVELIWRRVGTGEVLGQQTVPIDPATARVITTADFTPEVGQSLATATQLAVDDLARKIVGMMEGTW